MMKCPEIGFLQAYIDGELDIVVKKDIESHLLGCEACNERLKELKDNDDFVFNKIKEYRQFYEDEMKPVVRPTVIEPVIENVTPQKKGAANYMIKYKKFAAAVCAVALLSTSLAVQPVRAAISDALSIFRVENVEGINISLKDIEEIKQKFESKNGTIDLKNMGKIRLTGGQNKAMTLDEVKELPDLKVLTPALYDTVKPQVNVTEPSIMQFTLNVQSANKIMKTLGAETLLPQSVNGKTFSANFSSQVGLQYNVNGKQYKIMETKLPEMVAPSDVNVDEIYDALMNLPVLPENIKKQLSARSDWKNTMYFPIVESQMQEISINGVKGYISSGQNNQNGSNQWLIWFKDGVAYGIQSNTNKVDIIKVAESMR